LLEDGIDTDLVGEFTCKICLSHLVGCGPVLTRCAHLFCGDCMGQWFTMQPGNKTWAQRAHGGGTVPCPTCKEPLHKEDLHAVCRDGDGSHESKVLYGMLSNTRIVCANNPKFGESGNCNWIGEYGSYQDHVRSCKNLPINDCSASTPFLQEASHSKEAGSPVAELPTTTAPSSVNYESEASLCAVAEDPGAVESNQFSSTEIVPMEVAEEEHVLGLASDAQWTGLVGALMELSAKEYKQSLTTEVEEVSSTRGSDQTVEPSEEETPEPLSPPSSHTALGHCSGTPPPSRHGHLRDQLLQFPIGPSEDTPGQDDPTPASHFSELQAKNRQCEEAQYKARLHLEDAYNLRLAVSQQQAAMQWQASMQWQQAAQWRAQYEAAQMMQWQHANQLNANNAAIQQQAMQRKAGTKPCSGKQQRSGASNKKTA